MAFSVKLRNEKRKTDENLKTLELFCGAIRGLYHPCFNKKNRNMKKIGLSFLAFVSAVGLFAQTISVVGGPTLNSGDPVVVNYTGGTGSAQDWIGIYPKDTVPDGTPPSTTWLYITSPAGQVTFGDPLPNNGAVALPNGEWDVHLFCCDLYQSLVKTTISVQGAAPATVDLKKYISTADTSVTFAYSGGTGSPTDWVGIYKKGDVPGGGPLSLTYLYVPTTAGEITFSGADWPDLPAGEYEAHLFCCDIYTILGTQEFEIFEALAPSLKPDGPLDASATEVLFDFTGGTGSFTDWVGVYPKDTVPDGTPASTSYVYTNAINGTAAIPKSDLTAGVEYDAHLFCCDGYDILASYKNWTLAKLEALLSTGLVGLEKSVFSIQPQPAHESVNLVFDEATTGRVVFFDQTGRIERVEKLAAAEKLTVLGLSKGVHFARLETKKGTQTRKIVVE